jgi:cytoskeletal protein CcmA (bactofilin family)
VKRVATLALLCCSLAAVACVSVNVAAQGDGARIGGPLDVAGPLQVQGDLHVGGPATIHGPVQARALTVAGPVKTTFPRGEPPGPAGQAFATSLAVAGPLTVQGPLMVEGALVVAGPLTSEPGQESSEVVPQQGQVFAPRGDLPAQKLRAQTEWTE